MLQVLLFVVMIGVLVAMELHPVLEARRAAAKHDEDLAAELTDIASRYGMSVLSESQAVRLPVIDGQWQSEPKRAAGVRGPVRGRDTWVAEYGWPMRDRLGVTAGWYYRVHAGRELGFTAPARLTVRPQNPDDIHARLLGDITTESSEFNAAFIFTCPDRRFASDLMHPRLMAWLIDECPRFTFVLEGGLLLCIPPMQELQPTWTPRWLAALVGFTDHVPPFVAQQYG